MSLRVFFDSAPDPSRESELLSLGAERMRVCYANNVGDRSTERDGILDPAAWVSHAKSIGVNGEPSLVVFDIEAPQGEIFTTRDARYKPCIKSIVGTMTAMREAFPKVVRGIYGLPPLEAFPQRKWSWDQAPTEARNEAMNQSALEATAPLRTCDAIFPAVYDSRAFKDDVPQETRYRAARLNVAKTIAKGRPVYPFTCLWQSPGGNASEYEFIPIDRYVAIQIAPAIQAKCEGVVVWGAFTWYADFACSDYYTNRESVPAKEQAILRAAYARGFKLPADFFGRPEAKALLRGMMHERLIEALKAIRKVAA